MHALRPHEPCPCAAPVPSCSPGYRARLRRGRSQSRRRCHALSPARRPRLNHRAEVIGGVLAERCGQSCPNSSPENAETRLGNIYISIVAQIMFQRIVLASCYVSPSFCPSAVASCARKRTIPQFAATLEIKISETANGSAQAFSIARTGPGKLDSQRKHKPSSKAGTAVARVVPTDWNRSGKPGCAFRKVRIGRPQSPDGLHRQGRPGRRVYGSYQYESKVGTAQRFADQYYADWFRGTKPGSDEFSALWKKLATCLKPSWPHTSICSSPIPITSRSPIACETILAWTSSSIRTHCAM